VLGWWFAADQCFPRKNLQILQGTPNYSPAHSESAGLFLLLFGTSFRVVKMDVSRGMIMIKNPKARPDEQDREFTFDAVYDWK
jgi:hypothetical protein